MSEHYSPSPPVSCEMMDVGGCLTKLPCFKYKDKEWMVPITMLQQIHFSRRKLDNVEIIVHAFTEEGLKRMTDLEIRSLKNWLRELQSNSKKLHFPELTLNEFACSVASVKKNYQRILEALNDSAVFSKLGKKRPYKKTNRTTALEKPMKQSMHNFSTSAQGCFSNETNTISQTNGELERNNTVEDESRNVSTSQQQDKDNNDRKYCKNGTNDGFDKQPKERPLRKDTFNVQYSSSKNFQYVVANESLRKKGCTNDGLETGKQSAKISSEHLKCHSTSMNNTSTNDVRLGKPTQKNDFSNITRSQQTSIAHDRGEKTVTCDKSHLEKVNVNAFSLEHNFKTYDTSEKKLSSKPHKKLKTEEQLQVSVKIANDHKNTSENITPEKQCAKTTTKICNGFQGSMPTMNLMLPVNFVNFPNGQSSFLMPLPMNQTMQTLINNTSNSSSQNPPTRCGDRNSNNNNTEICFNHVLKEIRRKSSITRQTQNDKRKNQEEKVFSKNLNTLKKRREISSMITKRRSLSPPNVKRPPIVRRSPPPNIRENIHLDQGEKLYRKSFHRFSSAHQFMTTYGHKPYHHDQPHQFETRRSLSPDLYPERNYCFHEKEIRMSHERNTFPVKKNIVGEDERRWHQHESRSRYFSPQQCPPLLLTPQMFPQKYISRSRFSYHACDEFVSPDRKSPPPVYPFEYPYRPPSARHSHEEFVSSNDKNQMRFHQPQKQLLKIKSSIRPFERKTPTYGFYRQRHNDKPYDYYHNGFPFSKPPHRVPNYRVNSVHSPQQRSTTSVEEDYEDVTSDEVEELEKSSSSSPRNEPKSAVVPKLAGYREIRRRIKRSAPVQANKAIEKKTVNTTSATVKSAELLLTSNKNCAAVPEVKFPNPPTTSIRKRRIILKVPRKKGKISKSLKDNRVNAPVKQMDKTVSESCQPGANSPKQQPVETCSDEGDTLDKLFSMDEFVTLDEDWEDESSDTAEVSCASDAGESDESKQANWPFNMTATDWSLNIFKSFQPIQFTHVDNNCNDGVSGTDTNLKGTQTVHKTKQPRQWKKVILETVTQQEISNSSILNSSSGRRDAEVLFEDEVAAVNEVLSAVVTTVCLVSNQETVRKPSHGLSLAAAHVHSKPIVNFHDVSGKPENILGIDESNLLEHSSTQIDMLPSSAVPYNMSPAQTLTSQDVTSNQNNRHATAPCQLQHTAVVTELPGTSVTPSIIDDTILFADTFSENPNKTDKYSERLYDNLENNKYLGMLEISESIAQPCSDDSAEESESDVFHTPHSDVNPISVRAYAKLSTGEAQLRKYDIRDCSVSLERLKLPVLTSNENDATRYSTPNLALEIGGFEMEDHVARTFNDMSVISSEIVQTQSSASNEAVVHSVGNTAEKTGDKKIPFERNIATHQPRDHSKPPRAKKSIYKPKTFFTKDRIEHENMTSNTSSCASRTSMPEARKTDITIPLVARRMAKQRRHLPSLSSDEENVLDQNNNTDEYFSTGNSQVSEIVSTTNEEEDIALMSCEKFLTSSSLAAANQNANFKESNLKERGKETALKSRKTKKTIKIRKGTTPKCWNNNCSKTILSVPHAELDDAMNSPIPGANFAQPKHNEQFMTWKGLIGTVENLEKLPQLYIEKNGGTDEQKDKNVKAVSIDGNSKTFNPTKNGLKQKGVKNRFVSNDSNRVLEYCSPIANQNTEKLNNTEDQETTLDDAHVCDEQAKKVRNDKEDPMKEANEGIPDNRSDTVDHLSSVQNASEIDQSQPAITTSHSDVATTRSAPSDEIVAAEKQSVTAVPPQGPLSNPDPTDSSCIVSRTASFTPSNATLLTNIATSTSSTIWDELIKKSGNVCNSLKYQQNPNPSSISTQAKSDSNTSSSALTKRTSSEAVEQVAHENAISTHSVSRFDTLNHQSASVPSSVIMHNSVSTLTPTCSSHQHTNALSLLAEAASKVWNEDVQSEEPMLSAPARSMYGETYHHGMMEIEMCFPPSFISVTSTAYNSGSDKTVFTRRRVPYIQIKPPQSRRNSSDETAVTTIGASPGGETPRLECTESDVSTLLVRIRDVAFSLKMEPHLVLASLMRQDVKFYLANEFARSVYELIYNPIVKLDMGMSKLLGFHHPVSSSAISVDFLIHLNDYLRIVLPRFYMERFAIRAEDLTEFVNVKTYKAIDHVTPSIIEAFSNSYSYNKVLISQDFDSGSVQHSSLRRIRSDEVPKEQVRQKRERSKNCNDGSLCKKLKLTRSADDAPMSGQLMSQPKSFFPSTSGPITGQLLSQRRLFSPSTSVSTTDQLLSQNWRNFVVFSPSSHTFAPFPPLSFVETHSPFLVEKQPISVETRYHRSDSAVCSISKPQLCSPAVQDKQISKSVPSAPLLQQVLQSNLVHHHIRPLESHVGMRNGPHVTSNVHRKLSDENIQTRAALSSSGGCRSKNDGTKCNSQSVTNPSISKPPIKSLNPFSAGHMQQCGLNTHTSEATIRYNQQSTNIQHDRNQEQIVKDRLSIGAKFVLENLQQSGASPTRIQDLQQFLSNVSYGHKASTLANSNNNNARHNNVLMPHNVCQISPLLSKNVNPSSGKMCKKFIQEARSTAENIVSEANNDLQTQYSQLNHQRLVREELPSCFKPNSVSGSVESDLRNGAQLYEKSNGPLVNGGQTTSEFLSGARAATGNDILNYVKNENNPISEKMKQFKRTINEAQLHEVRSHANVQKATETQQTLDGGKVNTTLDSIVQQLQGRIKNRE